ncbi:MAG: hypothetical protein EAX95_06985 [Candidatus Thorarchaeota archaeon]|nr:hypothetical protein [Candidatus Thorarchaeota archaeon]
MEEECTQWERLAGEFAEAEKYYQAANQYKQAASCYLDRVLEMARKAAEYYHMHAEQSVEAEDYKSAATSYFEAATQYRQTSEFDTALHLYENAAEQALEVDMTETAAQAYLWAAFACHRLGDYDYFLTCAENIGNLYDKAAEEALEEGRAQRAVIDLSLAAMGFATINKMSEARDRIEKAKKAIDKTREEWLKSLLNFVEALTRDKVDEAYQYLRDFEGQETIQDVMGACLDIILESRKNK